MKEFTGKMKSPWNKRKHLTSFQIIIFSFAIAVLAGCLLLMLPFSVRSGENASFLDALFTSTSAVCVTGLVVHDTATYWSWFGQLVILLLIQIGGMGIVTMTVAIAMISGRKIGLMQRSTMQEAISAPKVGGIVRLTGFIIKTTIVIELIGAAAMLPVFCSEFGLVKGLWYAVFHSISAFCNAGFDLMGVNGAFSSLTAYRVNPVINIVIMLLIVIGGIGFLTWDDIRANGIHLKKYRMQSKVILLMTGILIIFPALYFFFGEFVEGSTAERVWQSLFQSITTRTAGFNTADLNRMSEVGQLVMVLLMIIGGAPGSTAGGMKTTTAAVLFKSTFAVFRRQEHAHFFGRRIADDTVKYASAILMMYIGLFFAAGLIISRVEGVPVVTCLFETASAIGTVGLTLGITPGLGTVSRCLLIVLMFLGRVGGLTLVFAAVSGTRRNKSKLPQEKITVG
jgi:trk system potassium uptake protein TrkH